MALRIFNEWDILRDGVITVDEIEDFGLDRDFAAALGRVLDCDKSGRIQFEGKHDTIIPHVRLTSQPFSSQTW